MREQQWVYQATIYCMPWLTTKLSIFMQKADLIR